MEYQIGRIGRVVVARGFGGEDVYEQIESLAAAEDIRCAAVVVIGGLARGKVVVGPKIATGPIEPEFREFDDAREIAGVGTIFRDEDGPKLHLHAAIGQAEQCVHADSLVLRAILGQHALDVVRHYHRAAVGEVTPLHVLLEHDLRGDLTAGAAGHQQVAQSDVGR